VRSVCDCTFCEFARQSIRGIKAFYRRLAKAHHEEDLPDCECVTHKAKENKP
jgi:hypothetical protein